MKSNLKDFKFNTYGFMNTVTDELKNLPKSSKQEQSKVLNFRDVWLYFLGELSDPSWTFYYMVKLNDPTLINIHKNRD